MTRDHCVVPRDQLFFGSRGSVRWCTAIRDQQVHPHQHEEEGSEDEGENDFRSEHLAPYRGPVECVEPQIVGVETGDSAQREKAEQQGSDHCEDDEPPVAAKSPFPRVNYVLNLSHRRRGYRSRSLSRPRSVLFWR